MASGNKAQQGSPRTPISWIGTELSPGYGDHAAGSKGWSNRNFPIKWKLIHYTLPICEHAHECLWPLWNDFRDSVLAGDGDVDVSALPYQTLEILALFLTYLVKDFETNRRHNCTASQGYVDEVLDAVSRDFIKSRDIHSVVSTLGVSIERETAVLAAYYKAVQYTARELRVNEPSMWRHNKLKELRVCSVFTGQGNANAECLDDLRDLWTTYKPLLQDLIFSTASLLHQLSRSSDTIEFYDNYGLEIQKWLDNDKTSPGPAYIASAPISFTIIGLINLANFCIICKATNMTPGNAIAAMQVVTGHSQGIVIAACIARAKSWEEFYEAARMSLCILFWIGYESHQDASGSLLSGHQIQDSLENGEGIPSHMLSVRGLPRHKLECIIKAANKGLAKDEQVALALVNSRDNVVLAGPPKSLKGIALHIRTLKASKDQDQSRIPYRKRKLEIFSQFLPVSAPFHSTYLVNATNRILDRLGSYVITGNELATAVISTSTGSDLRGAGDSNIIPDLVCMVTCQLVDWPAASTLLGATHIIEFGPGQFSSLMAQMKDGTGARVIAAGSLKPLDNNVGSKAELFDPDTPPPSRSSPNWETEFRPHVTKTASGQTLVETRFSKFLKLPPVMVAGMTPTTVPWDFVSAICNVGFHCELAGGGYYSPKDLRQAILNVISNIPAGRGLAVNLIYGNPRAIAWQIPLIRQLIDEGVPIDGVTIGAGVPSGEVAHDYITTMRLRYIGFKPGSVGSVKQVIDIANRHPDFPVIMQWTGGRGGGHHSFEDFHTPMLQMYGHIRRCRNIILVAGSGFGDAEDSYPYLTGDWARKVGYPMMPFDAILLGSRMMVAKEAHTSIQVKRAIVEAKGVADADWAGSYDQATGGVITVLSEMGQPIHKIATRGVLFWSEMDKMIFSLKGEKRLAALETNKEYIIHKLNADYSKVWFPKNASGEPICLEEMTYHQVVLRMIELMYVADQSRWISHSYKAIIFDFVSRIHDRFASKQDQDYDLERPFVFAKDLMRNIPQCQEQLLSPEDVKYFLFICKRLGRKPVNFVPCLNGDFEMWFKKDSLWQAEDVEAVMDQDVGRVCILQGPMAALYSKKIDEPTGDILNGINEAFIASLGKASLSLGDLDLREESGNKQMPSLTLAHVEFKALGSKIRFILSHEGNLPDSQQWFAFIASKVSGWAHEILNSDFIMRGRTKIANPIRKILSPQHAMDLEIDDFECPKKSKLSLRILTQNRDSYRQVVKIACEDEHTIDVNIFEFRTRGNGLATLPLRFNYDATNEMCSISEIMDDRCSRVSDFYFQLWFGKHMPGVLETTLRSQFAGSPVTLTNELISSFTHAVGGHQRTLSNTAFQTAHISIDVAILASWEVLMKPLLCREVGGDLLRLVHRSNSFSYVASAKILNGGDVLHSTSSIKGVYIEDSGKAVDVSAVIERCGKPVIEVLSTFLFQGTYQDFQNTFRLVKEPTISLLVHSTKIQTILRGQEWFLLDVDSVDLIGEHLNIESETRFTYDGKNSISSLEVSGTIYSVSVRGQPRKIGSVAYTAGKCVGNPVVDCLSRWGLRVDEVIKLKNPNNINEGQPSSFIAPRSNELYGRVSGDFNPIHVSEMFAKLANLPGTITHGMYTSAAVRCITEKWMAGGETQRFKRWSVFFTGMLLPGDKVQVSMSHTGMIHGRKFVEVTALNERSGDTVLRAEAEIEEPKTAYVFTGQGSQTKGMGMETYASSAVVRDIWDKADKYMIENYGWSLLEVVRNNPKSLTVHFGGQHGRRIRNNYLSMQTEHNHPDGKSYIEPILRDLRLDASSYTFMHPDGLLFLTQFAQPTLTLLEKATFVDMQSKGLTQQGAKFAGHSLGEYAALGSMTDFMSIEKLVSLAFYRGLTMSLSMERDDHGRTDYSMMAVNTSRVMKGLDASLMVQSGGAHGRTPLITQTGFDEKALKNVVEAIAQQSGLLLEIVNYNIESQQYVCAGHLKTLQTLSTLLTHITSTEPPLTVFTPSLTTNPHSSMPPALVTTIKSLIGASHAFVHPITLLRTAATVPLSGIDIPFHSSLLRPGVNAFRKYLSKQIRLEDVVPEQFVGRYVPNLTAREFELSNGYVEEVWRLTGSEVLRRVLDEWTDDNEEISENEE